MTAFTVTRVTNLVDHIVTLIAECFYRCFDCQYAVQFTVAILKCQFSCIYRSVQNEQNELN